MVITASSLLLSLLLITITKLLDNRLQLIHDEFVLFSGLMHYQYFLNYNLSLCDNAAVSENSNGC